MMIESNQRFGKYTLLERLAVGGMAEIYKAKTQGVGGFEKLLAIKRLHARLCEDQDFTVMLVDEAKLAVQLQHANIGQVFDLGFIDSQYFIVMEYIDGIDLHQLLGTLRKDRSRISVEAAIYIISQACEALYYAHTKLGSDGKLLEIVHRDVSPQNVMLSVDGEIKLVDFGIAKARMRAQQTQAGIIKGKFYYMSPEQAYGHRVDARTDVYAVGILLYEMFAGHNPYEECDDSELLKRVRQSDFVPLGEAVSDLDPKLLEIVDKALERNIDYRYENALDLQRALLAYAAQKCQPFSRVEMASYVHRVMSEEGGEGFVKHVDSRAMKREEYAASEASIIFDASHLVVEDHDDFEEDERTRVFDRGEDEFEESATEATSVLEFEEATSIGEFDEKTSMVDFDKFPPPAATRPPSSIPFELPETSEEPALVAGALAQGQLLSNAEARDTQPQFDARAATSGPRRWKEHLRHRPVQIVAAGGGIIILMLFFLILATVFGGEGEAADDFDEPGAAAVEPGAGGLTTLSVATSPVGARVSVDDHPEGITPIELVNLEVGRSYDLVFQLSDYSDMNVKIVAQEYMEPLIVRLEPLQGVLKIASFPVGATIRINGEDYGESPVTAVGIPRDGTHRIEATLPDGRTTEEFIEWEEGDERVKDIQLAFPKEDEEEEEAASSAKTTPRQRVAATPRRTPRPRAGAPKAGAPVGRSANRAEPAARGKEPLNIWEIGAQKETGRLNVRVSEGDAARIYIDERAIGRTTPLSNHEIDVGTYQVRVYFPLLKRSSDTRRVTVRANETATVVFSP